MAAKSERKAEPWAEGMSNIVEAARQNVTASRLAAAGLVALGAAALTYMWDPQRRSRMFESGQKFTDDLLSMWTGLTPAREEAETPASTPAE